MKIAVLSDTHDNIWNLKKLLKDLDEDIETIIHCGDMVAPFTTKILATADLPTYVVLGNNDEDHIGMQKKGHDKFNWVHVGQQFGEVELDKRKIAYTHYPRLGSLLADSGKYDAVFYGHTHTVENKMVKDTLLLNPGPVCGIKNTGSVEATYAIYDTGTNSAEIVEIWSGLSKSEEKDKQHAKEKAIKLAIKDGLALSRRGLEIYGINSKGVEQLIVKSESYKTLWQDTLSVLEKS